MDSDEDAMKLLDGAAVTYQLVLTKWDAATKAEQDAANAGVRDTIAAHAAVHPEPFATSAKTGDGIPELRAALATLAV